jgi:hypothetical protein
MLFMAGGRMEKWCNLAAEERRRKERKKEE